MWIKKRLFVYLFSLALFGCIAGILAATEWEQKPYTEWSREATIAMLTHSPWATREVVYGEQPIAEPSPEGPAERGEDHSGNSGSQSRAGASEGAQKARTYSITFMSARPIRMALARWALLSGNVTTARAEQYLAYNPFGDAIVIAVAVPPGQDASELENAEFERLQATTFLHLEKSDRKLDLVQYVPPSRSGNNGGLFFFPGSQDGQPTVTLEEEQIRFETTIGAGTRLDEEFRLNQMVFKGELEL